MLIPKLSFLDDVEPQILKRGLDLFEEGAVLELSVEEYDDIWHAEVQGTYIYSVEIHLAEDEVEMAYCDCPYDWGPVCKHKVAVLIAIRQQELSGVNVPLESKNPAPKVWKSAREELIYRAQDLDKTDLLEFIISEAEESRGLLHAFRLQFAGSNPENPKPDYAKMVAQAVKEARAHGEYHFINEVYLELVLEKLEKRIAVLLGNHEHAEAFEICYLILTEFPQYIEQIAEETYEVEGGISQAVDHISDLLSGALSTELKNTIAEKVIPLLSNDDIRSWGYDAQLWDGLMAAALNGPNYESLCHQVEVILLAVQASNSNWTLTTWINRKRQLLERMGREADAKALLESFIHLPEIRMLFVKKEMEAEQYHKAKSLIREGMRIENAKGWEGSNREWRVQLLEIARLEEDELDIRSHARVLFEDGKGDMKYYDVLKSTYSAEAWKGEVAKIIGKLEGAQLGVFADRVAQILQKEGYQERLLGFLKARSSNYHLVHEFGFELREQYPQEVRHLFRDAIEYHAQQHTGRSSYEKLVRMLKHLNKLEGGAELRKSLLVHFRMVYKRRPAMMEVLGKAFGG